MNQITKTDIVKDAKFKTSTGIIWIIDEVNGNRIETSMEKGAKGNYRDDINDVVDFLNEEKAIKL